MPTCRPWGLSENYAQSQSQPCQVYGVQVAQGEGNDVVRHETASHYMTLGQPAYCLPALVLFCFAVKHKVSRNNDGLREVGRVEGDGLGSLCCSSSRAVNIEDEPVHTNDSQFNLLADIWLRERQIDGHEHRQEHRPVVGAEHLHHLGVLSFLDVDPWVAPRQHTVAVRRQVDQLLIAPLVGLGHVPVGWPESDGHLLHVPQNLALRALLAQLVQAHQPGPVALVDHSVLGFSSRVFYAVVQVT
mmetsp:Transcript_44675/g.87513  ORF Transcript_44675/g.87513 Transcript_44675/m.87513 type:complete len:244 (+) Transcript_44675:212-943(+)